MLWETFAFPGRQLGSSSALGADFPVLLILSEGLDASNAARKGQRSRLITRQPLFSLQFLFLQHTLLIDSFDFCHYLI